MSQELILTRPDDWHVHFRDGNCLQHTVNATAQHFARALVMPNLKPALTTVSSLLDYRKRILQACEPTHSFSPLMTLYLTEHLSEQELDQCKPYPFILGAKLYPAGATTHSEEGVHSLKALYPLFSQMAARDLVLQIHGEVTYGDIFKRETYFIQDELQALIKNFPTLRIVLEHISTKAAVDFVNDNPKTLAATITPHHLLYNRNDLLAGGLRPHFYCLPILKSETAQRALQQAAISGSVQFFAGTDSAPHTIDNKENACACAGIYSAPFAAALYTQVFDSLAALPKLNAFMSHHGANFYRQPINSTELVMIKRAQHIPARLALGNDEVVPVGAGESLIWSVSEDYK